MVESSMISYYKLPQWNSCVHDHGGCCKAHTVLCFPHHSVGCSEACELQRMSLSLWQTLVASPALALTLSADLYWLMSAGNPLFWATTLPLPLRNKIWEQIFRYVWVWVDCVQISLNSRRMGILSEPVANVLLLQLSLVTWESVPLNRFPLLGAVSLCPRTGKRATGLLMEMLARRMSQRREGKWKSRRMLLMTAVGSFLLTAVGT